MLDLLTVSNLIALLTLTSLEIVLGIDNIVFIAIIAGRLPEHDRRTARLVGLSVAIITRLLLLLTLSLLASLTEPVITIAEQPFSGRDIVLILGGVFLIYKATKEIHEKTMKDESELHINDPKRTPTLRGIVCQIVLIDLIFSLDSVITAVGMTNNLPVMGLAIILAVIVMLIFSGAIVHFIEANPTVKMLALTFLLMIGFVLVIDGFGHHVEKGYIYFAMGFSLLVEMLNLRASKSKA
ncbi:MAG: TerC family protein [Proteobacteria bacterium]|nr:TerC family protein [Pseudomonadota bacterium]